MGRKATLSHLQPVLPPGRLCFTFLHTPSPLGLHFQLPLQGITCSILDPSCLQAGVEDRMLACAGAIKMLWSAYPL